MLRCAEAITVNVKYVGKHLKTANAPVDRSIADNGGIVNRGDSADTLNRKSGAFFNSSVADHTHLIEGHVAGNRADIEATVTTATNSCETGRGVGNHVRIGNADGAGVKHLEGTASLCAVAKEAAIGDRYGTDLDRARSKESATVVWPAGGGRGTGCASACAVVLKHDVGQRGVREGVARRDRATHAHGATETARNGVHASNAVTDAFAAVEHNVSQSRRFAGEETTCARTNCATVLQSQATERKGRVRRVRTVAHSHQTATKTRNRLAADCQSGCARPGDGRRTNGIENRGVWYRLR